MEVKDGDLNRKLLIQNGSEVIIKNHQIKEGNLRNNAVKKKASDFLFGR